ncbi:MAG: ThuA domain-containing protein [Acidobacteria bacterium]|nr:ThuA domain-containing protein [Acidobacteriota bacterium]
MSTTPIRAHVIVGGFPVGQHAGHDMDFARMRILQALQAGENIHATVSNDFTDCDKWIRDCQFLITYVAGPFADDEQTANIKNWMNQGGRWLAFHGSSGGKAVRIKGSPMRRWVKTAYHEALGSFFLTHPPIREFTVKVSEEEHPLTAGLPASYQTQDEPYMIEVMHEDTQVLLTTSDIKAPGYVAEIYGEDSSLLPDGKNRALGYVRQVGQGAVAYFAAGHCHSPTTNVQVTVHTSVDPDRSVPLNFRGAWDTEPFQQLLKNGVAWGTGGLG